MIGAEAAPHDMSWEEIQVESGFCPEIKTTRVAVSQAKQDKSSVNVKGQAQCL